MNEARLLVLDTCGIEGSVALTVPGEPVVQVAIPPRGAASESLPVVKKLLAEAGLKLRDLHALGVVHGPGSFTGVRVGVSLAKGLADASGLPLVAISRLAVLQRMGGGAWAALDAGRGEFYVRHGAEEWLLRGEELRERAGDAVVTVCEERVRAGLEGMPLQVVLMPGAVEAVPLVAEALREGRTVSSAALDAHYLRRPDAELALHSSSPRRSEIDGGPDSPRRSESVGEPDSPHRAGIDGGAR